MNTKDLRKLISECIIEVIAEELQPKELMKFKNTLFSKLIAAGFRQESPNHNYVEFYVYNYATVQCSFNYNEQSITIERFYDSEMFDHKNITKKIPLPNSLSDEFIDKVVNVLIKLKNTIKGDEAVYGGIDNLQETESNEIKDLDQFADILFGKLEKTIEPKRHQKWKRRGKHTLGFHSFSDFSRRWITFMFLRINPDKGTILIGFRNTDFNMFSKNVPIPYPITMDFINTIVEALAEATKAQREQGLNYNKLIALLDLPPAKY